MSSQDSPNDLNDAPGAGGQSPKKKLKGVQWALAPFVAIALAFYEPAAYLRKTVYRGGDEKNRLNGLHYLGVIVSLLLGSFAGYVTGWLNDIHIWWLPLGVIVFTLTYFYGWPGSYQLVFRRLGRLRKRCWELVDPIDKKAQERYYRHHDSWLTTTLKWAGYIASVGAAAFLAHWVWNWTHAYLSDWWSIFRFAGQVVAGGATLVGVGAALICLFKFGSMRFVAALAGAAVAYLVAPWAGPWAVLAVSYLPWVSTILNNFHILDGSAWLGHAIVFYVVAAYLFPLLHWLINKGLGRLPEGLHWLQKQAYEEPDDDAFRQSYLQLVNIIATLVTVVVAHLLLSPYALAWWIAYPAIALAGVLSYSFIGKGLLFAGNGTLGFLTGAGAAWVSGSYFFGFHFIESNFWNWVFSIVVGWVGALFTGFVLYPGIYVVLRAILKFVHFHDLQDGLMKMHEKVCTVFYDELVQSYSETYSEFKKEKNGYREFFQQVVNLYTAYHLASLAPAAVSWLGFLPDWSVWVAMPLVFLLSYTLFGLLLKEVGNMPLGVLGGAHVGYVVYNEWLARELWFGKFGGVASGAISGALTLAIAVPVTYVILRAILQFFRAHKLGWRADKLHEKVCTLAGDLVEGVLSAYSTTYEDRTNNVALWMHVLNALALGGWAYGIYTFAGAVGMVTWLWVALLVLILPLSYILIGKLLLKGGNRLAGFVAGVVTGVGAGAYAWNDFQWYWACAIALAGFAVGYLIIYTVVYALYRAVADNFVTSWAEPPLTRAHNAVWAACVELNNQFMDLYRQMRDWAYTMTADLRASWNETWTTIKQNLRRDK